MTKSESKVVSSLKKDQTVLDNDCYSILCEYVPNEITKTFEKVMKQLKKEKHKYISPCCECGEETVNTDWCDGCYDKVCIKCKDRVESVGCTNCYESRIEFIYDM